MDCPVKVDSSPSKGVQQAVREDAQYAPAPVRRTLQPSSSPYTPYACSAQRALFHEYL